MKPGRAFWVFLALVPLAQSCAGVQGSKGIVSKGQVEITNEQYQIEEIGPNHYVRYRGIVKNWTDKPLYDITANFVGFDARGAPVVSFKHKIAPQLDPGTEHTFEFQKSVIGTSFDRFGTQIRYLEKKPSFLDSFAP